LRIMIHRRVVEADITRESTDATVTE
jgi:hypothetical protein